MATKMLSPVTILVFIFAAERVVIVYSASLLKAFAKVTIADKEVPCKHCYLSYIKASSALIFLKLTAMDLKPYNESCLIVSSKWLILTIDNPCIFYGAPLEKTNVYFVFLSLATTLID